MTRITTTFPKRHAPQVRTITVSFSYDAEDRTYEVEAQVEKDGIDSYTMVHLTGADDVSDELYAILKEEAEEKAYLQDNPVNAKGCQCPPYGEGTLAEMVHDDCCPIKLRGAEREAYDDLVAKEKRQAYAEFCGRQARENSSYSQEQRRQQAANTQIYLDLK